MSPDIPIRRPTRAELALLPDLETASYTLYAEIGMAELAAANSPDYDGLRRSHAAGHVLIALHNDVLAGFVELREVDSTLYVAGVSVSPAFTGRRIGAALLDAAAECARMDQLNCLSLTTFRDVPWNAPYYLRLGWRIVPDDGTSPGLLAIRARQRAAGHERWPRVTMFKDVQP